MLELRDPESEVFELLAPREPGPRERPLERLVAALPEPLDLGTPRRDGVAHGVAHGIAIDAHAAGEVVRTLAGQTGTQEFRTKLLGQAQKGLDALIKKGEAGKSGADRTLVAAHRQMGRVYQLLGKPSEALKEYAKAADTAAGNASDHGSESANITGR